MGHRTDLVGDQATVGTRSVRLHERYVEYLRFHNEFTICCYDHATYHRLSTSTKRALDAYGYRIATEGGVGCL